MRYEIRLDKKNGVIWDITNIVSKATLTLKRTGSCGTLNLTCVNGDAFHQNVSFEFENGDIIQLYIDGVGRFYGYIFKIEHKINEQSLTITCYDQIKYLLYNATYSFVNKKANEVIKQIAEEFKLRVGNIADTQFVIPKLLEDNKKLLDICYEALYRTSDNGGGQYCLFDDFGYLTLKALSDMKTSYVLSDTTHLEDATFTKDIEDTYTLFKIVRDNETTGGRDAFQFQNTELISKWGKLQYFEVINESGDSQKSSKKKKGMNDVQIQKKLEVLSELKSRERKTFEVKSIGEFVRSGESLIIITEDIKQYFVIDEVKHTFENGNVHNMDLKLYVA